MPLVDDEYHEQVAVYQSVLRSKRSAKFVVVELGARWGTWATRAIAMLRNVRAQQSQDTAVIENWEALLVEPDKTHCEGAHQVLENQMTERAWVHCKTASIAGLLRWIEGNSIDHIDLIDMDIQGAEKDMLNAARMQRLLNEKVYRVIIGTHTPIIHNRIKQITHTPIIHNRIKQIFLNNRWHLIHDVPHVSMPNTTRDEENPGGNNRWGLRDGDWMSGHDCAQVFVRGYGPKESRHNWDRALRHLECYQQTSRGPVVNYDGELIRSSTTRASSSRIPSRWLTRRLESMTCTD